MRRKCSWCGVNEIPPDRMAWCSNKCQDEEETADLDGDDDYEPVFPRLITGGAA